jgi:adenylate cyclase
MVMFNAPMPVENHEMRAVQMALAMREALSVLSVAWRKRGHMLGFGVGIAGGYATIGTIGFEQRRDYGSVGSVSNLAERLCGDAKDTQILIAPRILAKIEANVDVESVGELTLKGFQRPVLAHNVLAIRQAATSPTVLSVVEVVPIESVPTDQLLTGD